MWLFDTVAVFFGCSDWVAENTLALSLTTLKGHSNDSTQRIEAHSSCQTPTDQWRSTAPQQNG
jgi:hypothetical protein